LVLEVLMILVLEVLLILLTRKFFLFDHIDGKKMMDGAFRRLFLMEILILNLLLKYFIMVLSALKE